MNSDTGKVYTSPGTITAAEERGEKLVPVSRKVASLMAEARQELARFLKKKRRSRARHRIQKASRKGNRS